MISLIRAGIDMISSRRPIIRIRLEPMRRVVMPLKKILLNIREDVKAKYTAIPPRRGVGLSCILRQFGSSRIFSFKAMVLKKGVIKYEAIMEKMSIYNHLTPD